jgi:hypothetical protein
MIMMITEKLTNFYYYRMINKEKLYLKILRKWCDLEDYLERTDIVYTYEWNIKGFVKLSW